MKYYIGVDIGGTEIKIGVLNIGKFMIGIHNRIYAKLLSSSRVPTKLDFPENELSDDRKFEEFVKKIATGIKENIRNIDNFRIRDIQSIGIGIPGAPDYSQDELNPSIRKCKRIRFLERHSVSEIKTILAREIGVNPHIPLALHNDAVCAALAEKRIGSLAQNRGAAGVVIIGTGVGCSIVGANRKIYNERASMEEAEQFAVPDENNNLPVNEADPHFHDFPTAFELILKTKILLKKMFNTESCTEWIRQEFPDSESIDKLNGEKFFNLLQLEKSDLGKGTFFTTIINDFVKYLGEGIVRFSNKYGGFKTISAGGGIFATDDSLVFGPLKEKLEASGIKLVRAVQNSGLIGAGLSGLEQKQLENSKAYNFGNTTGVNPSKPTWCRQIYNF